jgi:type II secretion system protein G
MCGRVHGQLMTDIPNISQRERGAGVIVKRHSVANQRGFTLIELLVVVAILAILAALLIPNFMRSRGHAMLAASKSHIRGIANALESYYVDNGAYPATGIVAMKAALQGTPMYVQVVPREACTRGDFAYTLTGPADYTLATPDLSSTLCAGFVTGNLLYYRPGEGFTP